MLTSLDPHSSYLSPNDFEDMRVQTRGEFGGLGIEITQQDGLRAVIAPIDDTPADKAGMQAGDLITHVDGESVLGLTLQQAVELMRGPVGSEIVITIVREGVNEPFDVSIIRDTIRIQPCAPGPRATSWCCASPPSTTRPIPTCSGLEGSDRGSGRHGERARRRARSAQQPRRAADPGDPVSDAFLDQGEIVSTRGRDQEDSERYNATPGDLIEGGRWSC
jgi:carboxyl-terminal processing protease